MEQEKPFKTIEVTDAKTRQVCKVACMSCIRGHRTTSCGIPVCRSKIFWTVKRPGRPSNSCNCRFGATGGCKCVVARTACPHKSKKGEKRSGQCRCDEQGRYCCLIEPEQWDALLLLQKPYVEFYHTREALETRHTMTPHYPPPHTPAHIASSPHPSTIPSRVPPLTPHPQPAPMASDGYPSFYQSQTTLTPRFGVMGISGPLGSNDDVGQDLLVWDSQASLGTGEFDAPFLLNDTGPEQGSCCQPAVETSVESAQIQQSTLGTPSAQPPLRNGMATSSSHDASQEGSNAASRPATSLASAFNFERLQNDYFNYQFPSAICQNCGLNGCTCRNCPPVFQNFGTTSWAQCCGRKHAREVQPTPPPVATKIPRTETWAAEQGLLSQRDVRSTQTSTPSQEVPLSSVGLDFTNGFEEPALSMPIDLSDLDSFELGHDLLLTHDSALSDFLLSDIDQSKGIGVAGDERDDKPRAVDSGGGTGGCCCDG